MKSLSIFLFPCIRKTYAYCLAVFWRVQPVSHPDYNELASSQCLQLGQLVRIKVDNDACKKAVVETHHEEGKYLFAIVFTSVGSLGGIAGTLAFQAYQCRRLIRRAAAEADPVRYTPSVDDQPSTRRRHAIDLPLRNDQIEVNFLSLTRESTAFGFVIDRPTNCH